MTRPTTKGKSQTASDQLNRYIQESVTSSSSFEATPKGEGEILRALKRNLNRIVMLPVARLVIEDNVRKEVDTSSHEFHALVDSVKENGVQQSIIVNLVVDSETEFRLVVVAGQRRVLAARQVGLDTIAGLILQSNARGDRLAAGLAENILRENLHVLDQAEAYMALIHDGWDEEKIANTFERGKKTIQQYLRLARYPEAARAYIRKHRHKFSSYILFNQFVGKKWDTDEELLAALKRCAEHKSPRQTKSRISQNGANLKSVLSKIDGVKCTFKGTDDSGQITIKYSSRSSLVQLLHRLSINQTDDAV